MDRLYPEVVELLAAGQPFSLATVVHTAGSTPQKAGARAIFLPDGRVLGTLGGGCMEAESRRRGLELIQSGEPIFYELHLDDDFGWDDGLICGGTAQILIQPMRKLDPQPFADAIALAERRGRGALATIVSAGRPPASPDPEAVGVTILVREDGTTSGVAAPEIAAAVVDAALAHLAEGHEAPRRVSLAGEQVVYLEPILPRPTLLIAGAGHVGAALAHYGARLGFEVVVVDDRPSFANRERLPDAAHVLVEEIVGAVRRWPKTPDTYVVIVTRGHRNDAVVLREVIGTPVAYIGMIGSRRKVLTIYDEFLAEGLSTPEQLARVHAPIGLDIGAVSVDEIAMSIAAELVMIRRMERENGHGDRTGSGRVAADGQPESALALRERERDRVGRSLAATLPDRRSPRRRRPPGECCS